MVKQSILRFGTDGWRGIIADQFTFANVRKVAQAIATYLNRTTEIKITPSLVIGYDTRFLSHRFARTVAEILTYNNIKVILSQTYIPTPVLSFTVRHKKATAGIMITASHNTGEYNGIKFKGHYGGSAEPELTRGIESCISATNVNLPNPIPTNPKIPLADFLPAYRTHIHKLVDLDRIKRLKVVIDSMNGAGGTFLYDLLNHQKQIIPIRFTPEPTFSGLRPEPIPPNITFLQNQVLRTSSDFGVATDGDADRLGVVDDTGTFLTPAKVMALLITHLLTNRHWNGDIVKTTSVSLLIDKLCNRYGLKLYTTPVGFKHICQLMLKENILLGGEESGGIGIKNHLPERDGIFATLLLMEYVSTRKKPLSYLVAELNRNYGGFEYSRQDVDYFLPDKLDLIPRLTKKIPTEIAGLKVLDTGLQDGIKFFLTKDSWLLIRVSDTEPLIRFYAEAKTKKTVTRLLETGKKMLFTR